MQPLTLLWGCLLIPGCRALMGPKEIRGFEGDTVSLQCTYEEELRTYKKYWCRRRGFLFSRCSGAIYVEGDGQERTEGRVSVQDRPRELILKVTLRNLTLQDAGNYFCGVKKLGPDETFMVSLLIFPETKLASGRVARKGQAGGQLGTRNSEGPSGRPQGPQEGRPAISWNLSSVAPGPCCPLSPAPSFQPLATNSLQPKAKAWQTQPPGLRTSHPASPLDPTSAEDASVVSSSSSKSSSTGHRGTEEQEGPTLTLASREELHPRVRLDQSCRAHWAPCQPEALCQPPHGDPVPKPDFRGR
ncbi:CMRF35-like molecule 9 isoform X10 [Manis pentadactyla]|uniref:CMRF35-like molecule 9 isoform X10 n=1 Tax=Manis pentadactyla TaxID=143292 RepID=UPI00255CA513|nr:CMRF35-like molecule 9 isoform X10 [Manis pentadactyla]